MVFPDKCSIVRGSRRCPSPPQFVVSVVSGGDEYMVGVTCHAHKMAVSEKVLQLQKAGRIPGGTVKFGPLRPVGTDCIRADPGDRIQIDPS